MTDPDLQTLLDRAARLKRRIDFRNAHTAELSRRLDKLKVQIADRVTNCPSGSDLAGVAIDTKGGGQSWTLPAARGAAIRITQPAAKLLGRISGDLIGKLKKLCGPKFSKLFVPHYTCEKNFRALAWDLLAKDDARKLISLVEEPSKATVTIT